MIKPLTMFFIYDALAVLSLYQNSSRAKKLEVLAPTNLTNRMFRKEKEILVKI
jgi:hypothetical protein